MITFHPDVNLEQNQSDAMLMNPVSKNFESMKKKNHFSTISVEGTSKSSSQSFKIGLRPVNIETWRMKKKNFQ